MSLTTLYSRIVAIVLDRLKRPRHEREQFDLAFDQFAAGQW